MPTLTVIAGPNGAGKSTLTATEKFEGRANLVDPDAIARRMNPFDPARAAGAAGREALTRWREHLAGGISFAVETTLAGNGILALMREAKSQRYHVHLLYVGLTSPELHVDRVRLRASQGGHDVPDEDIRRRYHRSLTHAPDAGFRRQRLLEFRDGRLTWRAVRLPDWAHDIAREISRV